VNDEFAGYGTLMWESDYIYFKENKIPEINDLNVLMKFQKQGIATQLINAFEKEAMKSTKVIGLCVGLLQGYGKAQRLYHKLGYVPDGLGLSKDNHFIEYFEEVIVDDDLVLGYTKDL
jgi:GNAT superfamily N-acetyltransferase